MRALLQPHLDGTERAHGVHGTCLIGDGLARRAADCLFSSEDRDGLVALNTLDPIAPGVFRAGGVVVFAHPGFRRSLSRWNSLNEYLLAELCERARTESVDEVLARAGQRSGGSLSLEFAVEAIHAERDSR